MAGIVVATKIVGNMKTFDDELGAEWEKGVVMESGTISQEALDRLAEAPPSPRESKIIDFPINDEHRAEAEFFVGALNDTIKSLGFSIDRGRPFSPP